MNYKRLSDEEKDDYIWRICSNKNDKLYDLTWEEVGEILNSELGKTYTSSKWRKNYQVMKKGYDRAVVKNADIESEIEALEIAKMEANMATKKRQTEGIFVNRVLREHSREEMLKQRVIDAMANAEKIPLPKFEPLQVQKISEKEHLLIFSDVHAYKIFTSITNSFSKAILEERMAQVLVDMKELVKHEGLEHVTVLNGGDSLENILRISALSLLEIGVIDTVVEYRRFLAKWISDLSKIVKVKYIHLISSNHSELRPLGTRAGQMPSEDFEKDIANYIKDVLSTNERVEVVVPITPYYHLKISNQDILCHHGHNIGNPKTYIDSMSRKLKVWFNTLIIGHYHSEKIETIYEDIDGGDVEVIVVPSVVGSCEYADSINKGSKASALVLRFDAEKGRDKEYKFILN